MTAMKDRACAILRRRCAWPCGRQICHGDDKDKYSDEKPAHEVEVSPFRISEYPITNAQLEMFSKDNGYEEESWWSKEGWELRRNKKREQPRSWDDGAFNLPNQPVVGVSWFEAEAFCSWMTAHVAKGRFATGLELDGRKWVVRLPTEAEWEFAARGEDGRKYPWGNTDPNVELANCFTSQIGQTTAIGSYARGATPEGILDLAGNIWEWCLDWKDDKYYAQCKRAGVSEDPPGVHLACCVLRPASLFHIRKRSGSGSWFNEDVYLRSACRNRGYPLNWFNYWSFRVVLSAESRSNAGLRQCRPENERAALKQRRVTPAAQPAQRVRARRRW